MSRPLKRARTSGVRVARPIDKELKAVANTVTTSVTSTVLKTTTFPGTVVGLRWSMALKSLVASEVFAYWAIVVIPDGEAANTPAISDGADFYTPEQNVLAFGHGSLNSTAVASDQVMDFEGTTKTMRKLKQGDVLVCITFGSDVNGAGLNGVIQFFFKT